MARRGGSFAIHSSGTPGGKHNADVLPVPPCFQQKPACTAGSISALLRCTNLTFQWLQGGPGWVPSGSCPLGFALLVFPSAPGASPPQALSRVLGSLQGAALKAGGGDAALGLGIHSVANSVRSFTVLSKEMPAKGAVWLCIWNSVFHRQ